MPSSAWKKKRNHENYQQLRLNLLSQRVDLAGAQARLVFAENEFKRNEALFQQKIVSESEYDLAGDRRDALVAEVDERGKLVVEFKKPLRDMRPSVPPLQSPLIEDSISAAITAQEEQLRRIKGGATLRAPMDGIV